MDFYTIVQTFEDDEFLLSVLPTKWTIRNGWEKGKRSLEGQDLCFWPVNFAGYRLLEKAKKNPDIAVNELILSPHQCKIKRSGFQSYAEAMQQLKLMEVTSDTDGQEVRKLPKKTNTVAELFQSIKENTVCNVPLPETSRVQIEKTGHVSVELVPPATVAPVRAEHVPQGQLTLEALKNQIDIIDAEVKGSQADRKKILTLVSQISAKLDYMAANSAASPRHNVVKLKHNVLSPVNSQDELEALEESSKNDEFVRSVVTSMGRIMGKNRHNGDGATVCLNVVDNFFERSFLQKCSWTGLSRTKNNDGSIQPKVPFLKYQKVIDLFYQVVVYSDPSFSVDECEKFLKRCLQNSKQRLEDVKGIRKTSSRKRRKRIDENGQVSDESGNENEEPEPETKEGVISPPSAHSVLENGEVIVEEYVVYENE